MRARVIREYRTQYRNPIGFQAGETVRTGAAKDVWV